MKKIKENKIFKVYSCQKCGFEFTDLTLWNHADCAGKLKIREQPILTDHTNPY